eukprot:6196815-Pleurochrysis_carterae.AAC.6
MSRSPSEGDASCASNGCLPCADGAAQLRRRRAFYSYDSKSWQSIEVPSESACTTILCICISCRH